MSRSHANVPDHGRQSGMLLPVAMFLLVVLSALGAYAVRMTVLTNMAAAQDILAVNAYFAAKAGNDWAAYQIYQPDMAEPTMQSCPSTTTLVINGFSVQVSCASSVSYTDNGDQNVQIYQVTSVATKGTAGTADYVERQVGSTYSRCIQNNAPLARTECN